MNEKLTLESVVEKLSCDCSKCEYSGVKGFKCMGKKDEMTKELIKQILEQVKPPNPDEDTNGDPYEENYLEGINKTLNIFDENIKLFLENGNDSK